MRVITVILNKEGRCYNLNYRKLDLVITGKWEDSGVIPLNLSISAYNWIYLTLMLFIFPEVNNQIGGRIFVIFN